MKTIYFRSAAVLTLGLALGLTACNKQLEISPTQSVDATTALNSEDKVGSAVVGLYAELDDPNLYGTNLILVPELMAADNYITFQGTFSNFRDISRRLTRNDNTTAEGIWREAYQEINQTNLVLEALPVVATASLKAQYEGEARFVRGDMYFELVRLYAKQYNAATASTDLGVPINLTPVRTVEQANRRVARSTVAQVYAQAIDDLTKAIALLPTTNGTRATSFTAKALLARVYLQQGNYAAAGTLADDVIRNSGKSLAPTLQAVFTSRNSTETLFEIQQNDQNNAGTANSGLATHYASIGQLGRGDVRVDLPFANLYGPTDSRGRASSLLYNSTGARSVSAPNVALRTGKFTSYGQNIPVIRLAEMYLIRAETNQRLGTAVGAIPAQDIARIRNRSQADSINRKNIRVGGVLMPNPLFNTVTLQNILLERQLELAFEGFRIHDLKRTGTNIVTSAGAIIPITSDRLVLPIPKRETDLNDPANPVLIQNPGY
jgi:starch-binding outer membrane protein, SusD/RagB family